MEVFLARADANTVKKLDSNSESFFRMVEKKFKLKIDYSEESLLLSDDLISIFFKLRRNHYYIASGVIGSYLGFSIIKNIGGRWSKELGIEKIGNMKGVAQPLLRSRRRLANGMQDSLAFYFRSLKLSNMQDTSFADNREKVMDYYQTLRDNEWDKELLKRIVDVAEKKYVREEAADILGRVGDKGSLPELLKALKDSKSAYFSAIALQGIPDESAFSPLMSLMKKTRSPALKMQLSLALGSIGNPQAAHDLTALLSDDNEIICHYASMALGKIKSPIVVEYILNAMVSLPQDRLVYAIFVLEELGDKRAIPALIESLFSRDEAVKEAALRALQNLPDERAFRPLTFLTKDKSYIIRTLAGYALANFEDNRVIPYIKQMFKDEVQSVRHHGAKLLYWLEQGKKPPRCI